MNFGWSRRSRIRVRWRARRNFSASIIRRSSDDWRRSKSRSAPAFSSAPGRATGRPRRATRWSLWPRRWPNSIVEFERRVAGRDAKPTGQLRVTTVEAIGQHFMPAIMAQFQIQNPGVVIELILSNNALNLSRRDADVAIRLTNDPPETLVGRRICAVRWGIYCHRDLVSALASKTIDSAPFIGFCESFGPAAGATMDRDENPI